MTFANRNPFQSFFLLLALLTLASCGGGSGGGSVDTANRTGTVGILLTDKPADPSLFESINASIEKIELMGSDENSRVSLYSGAVQVFDLLRLKNESIPFTFQDNVPVGEYCKIRLTLSDLELVLADNTPDISTDNETYHPKLPGNGKLDLVAKDCFTVGSDEVVTIQLDIDAGNSIHTVGNKKGFNFRPVIFVDVVNKAFDSKLVRLEGEITEYDAELKTLLVCKAIPDARMIKQGCVRVHFNQDAAFFDNANYSGAPRALDELLADDKVGQSLTIVGWPSYQSKLTTSQDLSILPVLMQLDALVLELGEFLQVEGQVAVDADADGFALAVSMGGPVITQDNLAVMFQPGTVDVNGTRIITKSGQLISATEVKQPLPVQVDGTLQLVSGSDPILNAALVILDKSASGAEQVTGTVVSVDVNTFTITPQATTVCGSAIAQLEVNHTAELEILSVTITNDSSEIVPSGVLAAGQSVGINGVCGTEGYSTDSVVIVDDQRV